MNGPLFPTGFEIFVNGYFGVLRVDDDCCRWEHLRTCRIEGLRYMPEVDEDWDSDREESIRRVGYPNGWEYFLTFSNGSAWGWETEAVLLAAGYAPVAVVVV